MKRFVQLLVFVLAVGLTLPVAAGASDKKVFVLALGDSATAGTQPFAPAVVPGGSPETEINRSGEGYADQLVAHLRAEGREVELVNLACYYETTVTMMAGGGLCSYPAGSQLGEATAFLKAHEEDTLAIVMSLGANDMLRSCDFLDSACYDTRLAAAGKNLGKILKRLGAKDDEVPIGMITYWDPFLALWFVGGESLAQATIDGIVLPLADMIETASAPYEVTVVDTLATFETENFAPVPGVGLPTNVLNRCTYSWMCAWNDIHLNVAGYGLIAQAVEQELGL